MHNANIGKQTLKRLPVYLNYLKSLPKDSLGNISATMIANALDQNDVQVRKDLSLVCTSGKPKIGYATDELIRALEQFLGYGDADNAILVGAGKLGRALLEYSGFEEYGLNIIAGFDIDEAAVSATKKILPISKLKDICQRMHVRIGIITVPASCAQQVCDILVDSGILAIWNFAPTHLSVPDGVLVHNENMASSLALLSNHLKSLQPNM